MSEYVRGPTHGNTNATATFEYKAGTPGHTGGGYPRWRSTEYREHTPGTRREDVSVPVHRLCAVAWLFEDGVTAAEILGEGRMVGADVHHTLGMPSANLEDCLELRDHGTHSEITQAQVRAWGEDAKRQADADPEPDVCADCGDAADVLATSAGFEGQRCLDCARKADPDAPIEV